ncbi:TIGR02679 family protein [Crossiella sp. NPDC003009]
MELDRARLDRLLGGADLAWLVERARRRLERDEPLIGTVTLTGASEAQRLAVHRLLGRRPRQGTNLSVSLSSVEEVLRGSGISPGGLAEAVVALTGPVVPRAAALAAVEQAWQAGYALVDGVVEHRPPLVDWWRRTKQLGLVRRLTGEPTAATATLTALATVLTALPVNGQPIGSFAARLTGDAHALDDDRPLSTLALGAARALSGLPAGTGAEWRREIWAAVGLLRDELSTVVLTLGLPGDPATVSGRLLDVSRQAGQPIALTLRQLVRDPPLLTGLGGRLVSVCENPVVVSLAADRLGARCPPLVCVSGQPGAAVMRLLRLLVATGASLRYHGDFDWGGLRIANFLFRQLPAVPWRFGAADYLAAAHAVDGGSLRGTPVTASWDTGLAGAIHQVGRRIEEELVTDDLLMDLRAGAG